jgi:hypothetical protein
MYSTSTSTRTSASTNAGTKPSTGTSTSTVTSTCTSTSTIAGASTNTSTSTNTGAGTIVGTNTTIGTSTSTRTSTRLLQVPRISSISPCVYFTAFGYNVALLYTAVCSTHSSIARCVLLFNGDVQTTNVLSQDKCRLNIIDWLVNKDTSGANFSLPYTIVFRRFQFEALFQRCVSKI